MAEASSSAPRNISETYVESVIPWEWGSLHTRNFCFALVRLCADVELLREVFVDRAPLRRQSFKRTNTKGQNSFRKMRSSKNFGSSSGTGAAGGGVRNSMFDRRATGTETKLRKISSFRELQEAASKTVDNQGIQSQRFVWGVIDRLSSLRLISVELTREEGLELEKLSTPPEEEPTEEDVSHMSYAFKKAHPKKTQTAAESIAAMRLRLTALKIWEREVRENYFSHMPQSKGQEMNYFTDPVVLKFCLLDLFYNVAASNFGRAENHLSSLRKKSNIVPFAVAETKEEAKAFLEGGNEKEPGGSPAKSPSLEFSEKEGDQEQGQQQSPPQSPKASPQAAAAAALGCALSIHTQETNVTWKELLIYMADCTSSSKDRAEGTNMEGNEGNSNNSVGEGTNEKRDDNGAEGAFIPDADTQLFRPADVPFDTCYFRLCKGVSWNERDMFVMHITTRQSAGGETIRLVERHQSSKPQKIFTATESLGKIGCVQVIPPHNGVVLTFFDGFRVYDADTFVCKAFQAETDSVTCVQWIASIKKLVCGNRIGEVKEFDVSQMDRHYFSSGTPYSKIPHHARKPHSEGVTAILPSTPANSIVTCSLDATIVFCHVDTRNTRVLRGSVVLGMEIAEIYGFIFSFGVEAHPLAWAYNVPDAKPMVCGEGSKGHEDKIVAVKVLVGQRYGVSLDRIGTIKIWDLNFLTCVQNIPVEAAASTRQTFSDLLYDTQKNRLVIASKKNIFVYQYDDRLERLAKTVACLAPIQSVAVLSEAQLLVTAFSGSLQLWNLITGRLIEIFENLVRGEILEVVAHEPSNQVILGTSLGAIVVLNLGNFCIMRSYQHPHKKEIRSLVYIPRVDTIVAVSGNGAYFMTQTEEKLFLLGSTIALPVTCVGYLPHEDFLLMAQSEGIISVWHTTGITGAVSTWRRVGKCIIASALEASQSQYVNSKVVGVIANICPIDNSRCFAASDSLGFIYIWNLVRGREIEQRAGGGSSTSPRYQDTDDPVSIVVFPQFLCRWVNRKRDSPFATIPSRMQYFSKGALLYVADESGQVSIYDLSCLTDATSVVPVHNGAMLSITDKSCAPLPESEMGKFRVYLNQVFAPDDEYISGLHVSSAPWSFCILASRNGTIRYCTLWGKVIYEPKMGDAQLPVYQTVPTRLKGNGDDIPSQFRKSVLGFTSPSSSANQRNSVLSTEEEKRKQQQKQGEGGENAPEDLQRKSTVPGNSMKMAESGQKEKEQEQEEARKRKESFSTPFSSSSVYPIMCTDVLVQESMAAPSTADTRKQQPQPSSMPAQTPSTSPDATLSSPPPAGLTITPCETPITNVRPSPQPGAQETSSLLQKVEKNNIFLTEATAVGTTNSALLRTRSSQGLPEKTADSLGYSYEQQVVLYKDWFYGQQQMLLNERTSSSHRFAQDMVKLFRLYGTTMKEVVDELVVSDDTLAARGEERRFPKMMFKAPTLSPRRFHAARRNSNDGGKESEMNERRGGGGYSPDGEEEEDATSDDDDENFYLYSENPDGTPRTKRRKKKRKNVVKKPTQVGVNSLFFPPTFREKIHESEQKIEMVKARHDYNQRYLQKEVAEMQGVEFVEEGKTEDQRKPEAEYFEDISKKTTSAERLRSKQKVNESNVLVIRDKRSLWRRPETKDKVLVHHCRIAGGAKTVIKPMRYAVESTANSGLAPKDSSRLHLPPISPSREGEEEKGRSSTSMGFSGEKKMSSPIEMIKTCVIGPRLFGGGSGKSLEVRSPTRVPPLPPVTKQSTHK